MVEYYCCAYGSACSNVCACNVCLELFLQHGKFHLVQKIAFYKN